MRYIELLYLIIPMTLIVVILIFYIYVNIKKRQLESFFDKHKFENSSTTNQIYTNELRSLSLVKSDTDTENIKEQAATMVYEIEKLKKENYDLSIEGKKKVSKYQIFASNKLFLGIVKNEEEINSLSRNFFDTVGMVLKNIKILRNEITTYKSGLRELKNSVVKKISELESPKSRDLILKEFGKIEINLKSLDDLVSSNQIERAAIEFGNLKQDFLTLIIFANNCEELEKVVFTRIPEYFSKIENLFEQTKKNTKCELAYIAFHEQINSIKSAHNIASSSFSIENRTEIENYCNKILTSLNNLNKEINLESNSYTFISKSKNVLADYKKNIAKLFISIKNDLLTAYQIDKVYFSQFDEEITKLLNFVSEIDLWIEKIHKDEDNFDISFSSKQFKFKSLFYQIKGFYLLYVEVNKKLEMFYLEGESNLLKFERLVILLRNMKSYIKRNYIILNPDEIKNWSEIENLREQIVNIILNTPTGTNPNIVNEYKNLLSLVVEYVSTVGLKIETSKIFIQVSKLLAPKRTSDPKLNEVVVMSENSYLDGNYNLALNNIIDTLNKGVN
ncbi:MAG: hypothetical protein ACRC1F_01105 [Metamycoplasmataceae bacterium]